MTFPKERTIALSKSNASIIRIVSSHVRNGEVEKIRSPVLRGTTDRGHSASSSSVKRKVRRRTAHGPNQYGRQVRMSHEKIVILSRNTLGNTSGKRKVRRPRDVAADREGWVDQVRGNPQVMVLARLTSRCGSSSWVGEIATEGVDLNVVLVKRLKLPVALALHALAISESQREAGSARKRRNLWIVKAWASPNEKGRRRW